MSIECESPGVAVLQSLVGEAPGGMVPVQVTVVVPGADGVAIVCEGGVDARDPAIASSMVSRRPAANASLLGIVAPFIPVRPSPIACLTVLIPLPELRCFVPPAALPCSIRERASSALFGD